MPSSTAKLSSRGFKRLIQLLFDHRLAVLGGLLGVVISDVVQLVVPLITKHVIDRLETHRITSTELLTWGGVILGLGGISLAAKQVWRHLILGAARKSEAELRRKLLDKTLTLTQDEASKTEAGKFMALASNDIPAIGQALAMGVIALFDSLFITGIAATLMLSLSPQLTAWTLLPFPILAAIMIVAMRLIYGRWDKVQETLETLTEKTRESLAGMRTLRAYVQHEGDLASFQNINERQLEDMLNYVRVDASFSPLILLFSGSSSAILLFVGGGLVLDGGLSIGTLAAFTGYLGLLTWPMIAAGWMLVLLQRGSASIDRLDAILQAPSEIDSPTPKKFQNQAELCVTHLNFKYSEGDFQLKDWCFSLKPGQVLGIVGPVGSGKTTLLRLLQALEPLAPYTIMVGDQDLAAMKEVHVRALFSPVSQEPFLFSDTIANNLRLGNPSASNQDLHRALDVACLTEELEHFPQGLETLLGERGISLSGGQRQRTALARALLKPAPFLLLDDTLSAVDTLTEQRILSALKQHNSFKDKAVLIVSHRLSAVKDADLILVTQDGCIVDRGTHAELASRPGLYSKLLKRQTFDEDEGLTLIT